MPFSSPYSKLFLILQDSIWYHLLQKVSWELSHPYRADILLDPISSQEFLSHSDSIFSYWWPSLKHKVLQAETAFICNFCFLSFDHKYLVSMEIHSRHSARLKYTTIKRQITNLCLHNMLYDQKYYGKREIHWTFCYLKWQNVKNIKNKWIVKDTPFKNLSKYKQ